MKGKYLLFILAIVLIIPQQARSQGKMRIAVLDFSANGVSKYVATAVSEIVSAEFSRKDYFIVVERSQMDGILKEQGLQMTGCTDSSCAVEVGKLLSANKILIGTVSRMGQILNITTKVVDVQSGRIDFAETQRARKEEDMDIASSIVAVKLINSVTGRNYPVLSLDYGDDYSRNRFAVDLSFRYGMVKGSEVSLIDGINSRNKYETDVHFWSIILEPSYELNKYTAVKLVGRYYRSIFGGPYYSNYYQSAVPVEDDTTSISVGSHPELDQDVYGIGTGIRMQYPVKGLTFFIGLDCIINRLFYNDPGNYYINLGYWEDISGPIYGYRRTIYYNQKLEGKRIDTDLSLGINIYLSKYIEILLSAGIELPVYNRTEYKINIISDNLYKDTGAPDPTSDVNNYLYQDLGLDDITTAEWFSSAGLYLQAGFSMRIF